MTPFTFTVPPPVVVNVAPRPERDTPCENPWLLYEKEKRKLQAANLSAWRYECEIKQLCTRLGI